MPKLHGTKRKLTSQKSKPDKRAKFGLVDKGHSNKAKDKRTERTTVPIPDGTHEDDLELSDQDLEVLEEHGNGIDFLTNLDHKAIARSKNHIEKLHQLSKPVRPKEQLPQVLSDSEDDSVGFSNSDISDTELSFSDSDATPLSHSEDSDDSDVEREYEKQPLASRHVWGKEDETNDVEMPRLPIKLPDGTVQQTGKRKMPKLNEAEPPPKFYTKPSSPPPVVDDVSTGARFGRAAVIDVVTIKDPKLRLARAQDQLASICQDIIADPENSLGLLRRLHSFALPEISSPTQPDAVANDPTIRKYAILSQLAVFKDIIPGYRIRLLTDHEKAEKVTQAVMRTREWEQGLVAAYQKFLTNADAEIKAKSGLYDIALNCMCTLLLDATHFNFRVNILGTVVTQLSRKSWTAVSQQCHTTLVTLFQRDLVGEASLDAVRHLNRMIKERRFAVHPNVLSCLLHLRLKTELHDVRASQSRASKEDVRDILQKVKQRKKDRPHLSKKAKKALKDNKVIQGEMKEAEAEVDKEERANRHTETLKLLFVIYFSILKLPAPLATKQTIQLVRASLQGIAKFAHLVNIDFFRDLMGVLRDLVGVCKSALGQESAGDHHHIQEILKLELMVICTAFELLTGQGEALNIDLDSFINDLFGLLPLLPFLNDDQGEGVPTNESTVPTSELLFQSLKHVLFSPNTSAAHTPMTRITSFSTRLISITPYLTNASLVLKILETIQGLLVRFPALDAHLDSEGGGGGAWYGLFTLLRHVDATVAKEAKRVFDYER